MIQNIAVKYNRNQNAKMKNMKKLKKRVNTIEVALSVLLITDLILFVIYFIK